MRTIVSPLHHATNRQNRMPAVEPSMKQIAFEEINAAALRDRKPRPAGRVVAVSLT
jgi:hypothetical protein